jgi:archaemetzincin
MGLRPEGRPIEPKKIRLARAAIEPLHCAIRPPEEGDWLAHHDERGQSFLAYGLSEPVLPSRERSTLYLQPLGDLPPTAARAMTATSDILERFYDVSVRTLEPMDLQWIPSKARRLHPIHGHEQLLSSFILRLVAKRKPPDALAVLVLTMSDLWPGKGWNFVFGQASLRQAVGVWSLHRMGDPEYEPMVFLRRALKTAVHEAGHMFGIHHCISYECGMNGANHQAEADAHPLWFCPEDEAKVWWGFGALPSRRYERLADYAEQQGLAAEAKLWRASEEAVRRAGS